MSGAQSECLVCAELDRESDVPGGLVIRANLVAAFHLPPLNVQTVYAGHVLVVPRRHSPGFAELTSREAAAIGVAVSDLSHCLQGMGAERVYTATIGHNVDHLHVHLLPRWPETPADVPWHVVEARMGWRPQDRQ